MPDPIVIVKVANGFIVRGEFVRHEAIVQESYHVFESMKTLQQHIAEHFEKE